MEQKILSYIKGVKEEWSLRFTGMEQNNVIIKPGIQRKADMVKAIPSSFWDTYSEYKFFFLDKTPMKQIIIDK